MNKYSIDLTTAQELHRAGHLTQAKENYLQLLNENPENVTVLHMLGILAAEEGNLEEAKTYLESAYKINPTDSTYALHLANIYKALKLFSKASQILQEVINNNPKSAAAYNNLGTVYYAEEKWQLAMEAYEQAIAIQPEYADAYYNLGLAMLKASRWDLAKNTFQSLLELSPRHAGGMFQLACMAMAREEYPQAIKLFNDVAKDHPYHFETQTNLATCYLKLGKLNEAKTHYMQALEIIPNDDQVLFNLGVINMQLGKVKEAVEFYLRLVKIKPDFFDAHNNLGAAFLVLKDSAAALLHFREALRLQPNNSVIKHMVSIISEEKSLAISPPEYIRSLFDSYADHYETHILQSLKYQIPQLFYDCLQKAGVLNNEEKWDILDLGCGTGLCGQIFESKARSLVGVDLSEKMLDIALQKKCYTNLVCADILPFLSDKTGLYDLILAGDVFVYSGDLEQIFKAIHQALRKHGYLIFNAEINDQEDYMLTSSGRFTHSKAYIDRLITQINFTVLSYKKITIRTQNDVPVSGHLYLLRK